MAEIIRVFDITWTGWRPATPFASLARSRALTWENLERATGIQPAQEVSRITVPDLETCIDTAQRLHPMIRERP
ncbi:hypothetical protein [Actinomadura viridis]|uniref:Uncharacterized protein n=1 Tax=Actinomadura viridis TaxID=58110 RepID=A0A931GLG0_9ACTN|nr:hypothetical protein [Actinomadura viridis]MBG6091457.1 hypothetical protein [Actinomadura viridis]